MVPYNKRRPSYYRKGRKSSYNYNYGSKWKYHKRGKDNPNHLKVTRVKGTGIPDVQWQKFVYAENNYVFPLGTVDEQLSFNISLNDPFDPYFSVGGKSALYFQQVMGQFKYARVYGASITLRVTDTAAADNTPMLFAIVFNSDFNTEIGTPTPDDLLALPSNRCKIMRLYPGRVGQTRVLSTFIHMSDLFYMTRSQYDNLVPGTGFDITNFGGITSPGNLGFASIYWFKIFNTGVITQCVGDISVTYYTKLWCRQPFNEPGDEHENIEPTPEEP